MLLASALSPAAGLPSQSEKVFDARHRAKQLKLTEFEKRYLKFSHPLGVTPLRLNDSLRTGLGVSAARFVGVSLTRANAHMLGGLAYRQFFWEFRVRLSAGRIGP